MFGSASLDRIVCRVIFALLLATLLGFAPAAQAVPAGFNEIASAQGLKAWKKDYQGGQPDYVIDIDLSQAHLRSLHGGLDNLQPGQGPLGGPNAKLWRQSLGWYWNTAKAQDGNAFAVVNAQFFSTNDNPTPLAFAVKTNGAALSDGYATKIEYQGQLKLFETNGWAGTARVDSFSEAQFESPDGGAEMIAGLDQAADKGPSKLVGRTFLGVRDSDGDGTGDHVLLFCSSYAKQADAAKVLSDFGVNKGMVMLDGGGSSQLIIEGNAKVSSSRTIPHAIGIFAGKPSAPDAQIDLWTQTSAQDTVKDGASAGVPDLREGDTFDVDVFVKCQGSGGNTQDQVRIGYQVESPWLTLETYTIYTDWPNKDGKTWSVNDSDGNPENPPKVAPPNTAQINLHGMSAGETKRVRLQLRAKQYSLGAVDHPDVRAWVWHVGGVYGDATAWDDPVEINKLGKTLQSFQQHDVYGATHWEWNGGEAEVEGWSAGGDIEALHVNAQEHALVLDQKGGTPWAQGPETSFTAADFQGFELRVRHSGGLKNAQLHWLRQDDGGWSGAKSAWLGVPGDGQWQVVTVRLADNPEWKGTITRLRIDPTLGDQGKWEVDFLRATGQVALTSGDADQDGAVGPADCDDTAAAIHPGATETCNGKDDNCDGQTDEDWPIGQSCALSLSGCLPQGAIVCVPYVGAACMPVPADPCTQRAPDTTGTDVSDGDVTSGDSTGGADIGGDAQAQVSVPAAPASGCTTTSSSPLFSGFLMVGTVALLVLSRHRRRGSRSSGIRPAKP
jgi:hypothetical protein